MGLGSGFGWRGYGDADRMGWDGCTCFGGLVCGKGTCELFGWEGEDVDLCGFQLVELSSRGYEERCTPSESSEFGTARKIWSSAVVVDIRSFPVGSTASCSDVSRRHQAKEQKLRVFTVSSWAILGFAWWSGGLSTGSTLSNPSSSSTARFQTTKRLSRP